MLTVKQNEIYQFLTKYIFQQGYAPSITEIASAIGCRSKGYIHRQLQVLVNAGLIERTEDKQRNIKLTQTVANDLGSLPIIGRIAAGQPIEAIEGDQYINLTDTFLGSNRFILQVKGDSMLGDNICNGDYIICERRHIARPDEIAVVLIDNAEATLKRLRDNRDGTISLIPSNPTFSVMVCRKEEVVVQGIYLGLLRFGVKPW